MPETVKPDERLLAILSDLVKAQVEHTAAVVELSNVNSDMATALEAIHQLATEKLSVSGAIGSLFSRGRREPARPRRPT